MSGEIKYPNITEAKRHAKGTIPYWAKFESSNLSSGYYEFGSDNDQINLVLTFNNGSLYGYKQVPEMIWVGLLEAESKGGYFNNVIKGNYEFEKLLDEVK